MRQHLERDELRYAIWLDPDPLASEQLLPFMADLRQRYQGPAFSPHLTLCSGITGAEAASIDHLQALAAEQQPFALIPQGLRVSGDYFRAITVATDLPNSLQLFRQRTCQRFGLDASKAYHPHLSIVYAELNDQTLKQLSEELEQQTWPPLLIQSCSLWRLQGPVGNWRRVAHVSFTG